VDWVLLKLDNMVLMLNKQNRPAIPDRGRIAAHTDTSLYFGCPDVDALYIHLPNKGLDLNKPAITGYGWKAVSLIDPDGYSLCFHWPLQEK
jgi:hypothetical protein